MAERQADEWTPSTWDELFPGRFLKHSHLGKQGVQVTIERIYNTTIDDKLAQVARIAPINGIEQRDWGLNKTNGLCLRAMFGDTIRDWFGKRVVVHASVVEHGREKGKPCIRVCASPDIPADVTVVIDFHTKRIKPFTIKIRSLAKRQPAKPESSERARELSALCRAATDMATLTELSVEVDTDIGQGSITSEEGSALLDYIVKQGKTLAEKAATNVIK